LRVDETVDTVGIWPIAFNRDSAKPFSVINRFVI
jgi:hypothetical protein